MNAERTALSNDSVEKHRGALCDGVVFDEELLELVDHQQRTRHRLRAAGLLVSCDILDTQLSE